MPFFKDKTNQMHFIDDIAFQYLLPAECVKLTDEEATKLQAPSLAQLKKMMWDLIQSDRDRRKAGGVLVQGHWIHSDDTSRIQQLALVMMGNNVPPGLWWKTMSGTFVEMTPALAGDIFMSIAKNDQAIFAIAEAHKKSMLESDDPASYDYHGGWPEEYEDSAS